MNEKDFAELSAAAALGALTPDQQRAFEAEVAQHPEREALVRDDLDAASRLAAVAPPVTPPPFIRDALLARIADDSTPDAAARPGGAADAPELDATPPPASASRRPRRWFALAASVVLLVAIGFGAVSLGQQLNPPPAVVALEEIQQAPDAASASVELDGGGEATAHWSGELGKAVLVSDGLPSLASDQSYELWFVRDEGPVPAGVFAVDDGEATALLTAEMHAGDVIAVTVEPAGGSPTGKPSGDPIFAIPTA